MIADRCCNRLSQLGEALHVESAVDRHPDVVVSVWESGRRIGGRIPNPCLPASNGSLLNSG